MRIKIGKSAPNPANFATFEAFAEAYAKFAESIRQVPLKRKGTGKYTYGVQIGSKPVIYGAKAKVIWEAHQRGQQQQKPVAAKQPAKAQLPKTKPQPAKAAPAPKEKDQKPSPAGGDLASKAKYVYGNAAGLDDKDIDAFIADVSNLGKNEALSVASAIDLRFPKTASKSTIVAGIKERIVSRKGSFQRAHLLERPTSGPPKESSKTDAPDLKSMYKDVAKHSYSDLETAVDKVVASNDLPTLKKLAKELNVSAGLTSKKKVAESLKEVLSNKKGRHERSQEIAGMFQNEEGDDEPLYDEEGNELDPDGVMTDADEKRAYAKAHKAGPQAVRNLDIRLGKIDEDKLTKDEIDRAYEDGATGDEEELSEIQKVPEQEPIRMETAKKDDKLGDSLSNLLKIAGSKGTGDFENDVAKLRMIDVIYLDRDLDRLREAGYGTNEAIRSAVDELSFMKQESESYSQRRKLTEKNINDRFDVVVGSINKAGNALKAIGNTDGSNVYLNDGVDIANKMREFAVKNYAVDSQSSNKADPDKRSNSNLDFSKSISDAVSKVSNDSATVMKQAESIVPKLQEKLKDVSPEVKEAAQDFMKEQEPSIKQKLEENNVSPSLLKKIAGAGLVALAGPTAVAAGITAMLPGEMIASGVYTGNLGTILGGAFIALFGVHGFAASGIWDAAQGLYSKGMKMMGKKFAEDDEMKLAKKLAQEILSDLATKWHEFAKKKGLK